MSKFCLTSVTSFFGSRPALTSAACCSNSLPKIQTPYFLPFIFAIELMPDVLARHLGRAAAGVHLSDVDEVVARITVREEARQPVDPELRLSSEHDLLGDDVRARRA